MSLSRLFTRSRLAPASTTSRMHVRPPAPWGQADSVWQSLWQWLRETPAEPQAAEQALRGARLDFCAALNGLRSPQAHDLRHRAAHACSLRELWHLRTELYGLIARERTQADAEARLIRVNRHFPQDARPAPSRTPRHELDPAA